MSLCSGKPWFPIFACLSLQLWGTGLPYNLDSFKNLRRVVIFQSVQIFICYWDGVMTSKLLTCRTKPTIFILIWKCKTWTRTLENCFCTAGCTFLGTSTERFELIKKPRSKKKNAIQHFWEIEKYLKQWDKFMGRLRGALPHWCPLGSIQKNKEEAEIEEKPVRVIPKFNTWSVQWEELLHLYCLDMIWKYVLVIYFFSST